MITYFIDKNHKSEKKKIYETLTSIIQSVDTVVIIAATTSSETLYVTFVGLIVVPISAAVACALSLGNKVLHEVIINKSITHKKQNEKDKKTNKSFDELYRKSLQDNIFDKKEYESLCNIFKKYVDQTKNESFHKTTLKTIFFCDEKINLKP